MTAALWRGEHLTELHITVATQPPGYKWRDRGGRRESRQGFVRKDARNSATHWPVRISQRRMESRERCEKKNALIVREPSVERRVYLWCFEPLPSQVVPRAADRGSAVTDSHYCPCFSADRWARCNLKTDSPCLCVLPQPLYSAVSLPDSMGDVISGTPALHRGGPLRPAAGPASDGGEGGKMVSVKVKSVKTEGGERERGATACCCGNESRVITMTSDGRA